MRAARYYDRGDVRIEEVPEPIVRPGTVGIDVAYCGICGSDLREYVDGPLLIPASGHPHPVSGEEAPITLGHEFSGVVYAVGEGVDDFDIGDHVVVEPYILSEGVDTTEANDAYHLSRDRGFIGLSGRGGGLSEKVVVERRWVHPVGDIPLDEAALIVPLSVAYHAFQRSEAEVGDFALIAGAGPIGLLTAAVLTAEGITVAISETSALRRQKAIETGVAAHVLDPRAVDVDAEVHLLTDGLGDDIAFECSSAQPALDALVEAVKPRGVIVIVSMWGQSASIRMHRLVHKEIELRGTIAYVHSHPQAIELVQSGRVDLKPFITARIGLDRLVDEGFDALLGHAAVKILVDPRL